MSDNRELPELAPNRSEAWVDRLLAADAAASDYVEDDGFSAAVVMQLPPQSARSSTRWIIPLMSVVGFLVGLGLLSGGESLSIRFADLVSLDAVSMPALLGVFLPLALLYWLAVGAAIQQQ